MAGLTYLYALSRHFRQRRRSSQTGALLASDPDAIEIVNDTRACSNVLVAVSERWNALRHCHEVFDKLSDAVLTDAINLQCSPPASFQPTPNVQPQPDSMASVPGVQSPLPNTLGSQTYGSPEMDNAYQPLPRSDYGTTRTNFYSGTLPLAVDSQFQNCFGELQHLYNGPSIGDPVMELSQDWLGYIEEFDYPPQSVFQSHLNRDFG
jgi:hypothetical protein